MRRRAFALGKGDATIHLFASKDNLAANVAVSTPTTRPNVAISKISQYRSRLLAERAPGAEQARRATVTASATARPQQRRKRQPDEGRDSSPASRRTRPRASRPRTPNSAGDEAEQRVFERIGREQPAACRAERLQDHRVVEPARWPAASAPASTRAAAISAIRLAPRIAEHELRDHAVDRLERVLHPHGRHGREGGGDVAQDQRRRAAPSRRAGR